MHRFWKTRRALGYIALGLEKLLRDLSLDLRDEVINPLAELLRPSGITDWVKSHLAPVSAQPSSGSSTTQPAQKPVIYASYAVDATYPGSHRYCGGEKNLNNLILLARQKGFEAYYVTLDGKRAGWLLQDAPTISLEEFHKRTATETSVRCVTSWIDSKAFLDGCSSFYYWDHELATSSDYQFPRIYKAITSGRIRRLGSFNRAIEAWFLEVFEKPSVTVRSLVDGKFWHPVEKKRVSGRIGYMNEGEHTEGLIALVRASAVRAGCAAEFVEIRGDEAEVLESMQSCEIFLVTNPGKSSAWGEGGPMTPHEAMACGTVPVCFDLIGPSEVVVDGYTGFIVPRGDYGLYAERVIELLQSSSLRREMSRHASEVIQLAHSFENRWEQIERFLDLPPIG